MDIVAELRRGVTTASADETRELAAALARTLPPEAVLALHGDLGVGKTTFVQGLARGLGIEEPVSSPTFNVCRFYRAPGPNGRSLAHLDAYRLDGPRQAEALLVHDFLREPWCIAVEWPGRIAPWLPPDAWHLDLATSPDRRHSVRLRP